MRFWSSRQFLVYYFNNIMALGSEDVPWTVTGRVKEMRELIEIYRSSFRLQAYSDVQIWKRIKKLYWKDWDDLLCRMMEFEKKRYGKE